jgi:hypothetical protein
MKYSWGMRAGKREKRGWGNEVTTAGSMKEQQERQRERRVDVENTLIICRYRWAKLLLFLFPSPFLPSPRRSFSVSLDVKLAVYSLRFTWLFFLVTCARLNFSYELLLLL